MRPSSSLRSLLSRGLSLSLSLSLYPSATLSVPFFFPFTRARSLRRFTRRSLLPLAATEAGVLPHRFEELPVHGFPIPEKLASDMVSGSVSRAFADDHSRSFIQHTLRERLQRN